MWSFAEASFLNDRIDQGMAVSEETSNHLLEQGIIPCAQNQAKVENVITLFTTVMYCDDPSTVDSASEILARLIRRRAWSLPCNAFQLCMSKLGFTMSIAVIDSDATMASEVPDELRANNIAAVLGLLHESLSARYAWGCIILPLHLI